MSDPPYIPWCMVFEDDGHSHNASAGWPSICTSPTDGSDEKKFLIKTIFNLKYKIL